MKVTIDTKEDSHEDIKKVLQILMQVINQKDQGDFLTKSNDSVDTTNMMSMFGSSSNETIKQKDVPNTPPDFTSLMNLVNSKEKKEDEVYKVEFF